MTSDREADALVMALVKIDQQAGEIERLRARCAKMAKALQEIEEIARRYERLVRAALAEEGEVSRCRRYHPVWLTHAEMSDVLGVLESRRDEGSYFGNQKQFTKRLDAAISAVDAALFNCIDEMERPKR